MRFKFNKIKVSRSSTSKLSVLRRRTGLTPNLLCRIGFCLSLEKQRLPSFDFTEEGSEFNRYTLTGEWDALFVALLRERLRNDCLDFEENGLRYFKAHLNRGISLVHSRVKSITDLERLL